MFCCVRRTNTDHEFYIDGVSIGTSATDTGSITAASIFYVGRDGANNAYGASATNYMSNIRMSTTVPTDTQIRQMYDAEKGMFVASAECLLQSGSTDAVLDVDVDPLSGKVIVTQTDAITVFDGLVVDSKPTVNSGASEKGKLWGDLRAEQNAANAYVTAPATDQRQVNEMVRGLASDLPKGVDLSKAAAWCVINFSSSVIDSSYNIKSVEFSGTGVTYVNLAIPLKAVTSGNWPVSIGHGTGGAAGALGRTCVVDDNSSLTTKQFLLRSANNGNSASNPQFIFVAVYGELENE
jgi:hypothetical protein